MLALKLLCLFVALHQEVPVPEAQDEPKAEPETQAVAPSNSILDLRRLELVPQLGFTTFSPDFEGDPSPCLGLLLRAPLPFLAPREDAERETFGAFLQFTWLYPDEIVRRIQPFNYVTLPGPPASIHTKPACVS